MRSPSVSLSSETGTEVECGNSFNLRRSQSSVQSETDCESTSTISCYTIPTDGKPEESPQLDSMSVSSNGNINNASNSAFSECNDVCRLKMPSMTGARKSIIACNIVMRQ